jgi:putative sigma-54 modulation protein
MNIQISSIHFTADSKLTDYIEKKLQKLDQMYDRIIRVDVKLKLENTGQVKDKIVEITVKVPQETLIASESSKTFEAATDKVTDTIRRRIKKHKDKFSPRHSRI